MIDIIIAYICILCTIALDSLIFLVRIPQSLLILPHQDRHREPSIDLCSLATSNIK